MYKRYTNLLHYSEFGITNISHRIAKIKSSTNLISLLDVNIKNAMFM